MARFGALAIAVLLLTACPPSTEPNVVALTVSGTVTVGGNPEAGALIGFWRNLPQGGVALVDGGTTDAAGRYQVAANSSADACDTFYVAVDVNGPTGAPLHNDETPTDMCGENIIDFAF